MRWLKRHYVLVSIVLFIVLINVLFYFVSPREIVTSIGLENSYVVVFLVASIGGLSTLTGTTLFTAIATFAAGGASPLFLGLIGGIGIFISDSIFFHLALYGRKLLPTNWEKRSEKLVGWIHRHPERLVKLFIYIYLGLTPLPNDLLMIVLAFSGYTYRKIVYVLLAGSITVAIVVAYLGETFLNFFN